MKHILCFGDSNTFGYDGETGMRFPRDVRWTGLLTEALQDEALLTEDGCCGRSIGNYSPLLRERNALTVFASHMRKRLPIDALLLMLGTNDALYTGDGEIIRRDMAALLTQAKDFLPPEQILVVLPVPVKPDSPFAPLCPDVATPIRQAALAAGTAVANAADWHISLSPDGCHFSPAGHRAFAECVKEPLCAVASK